MKTRVRIFIVALLVALIGTSYAGASGVGYGRGKCRTADYIHTCSKCDAESA